MAKDKERWTIQILNRFGTNVLVIYDEDTSVGNINVEDDDIDIWMTAIKILNLDRHTRQKLEDRLDMMIGD